jgi:hypothetical protein
MQLCHPRRAQNLVTRVSEQPDIVGSFLTPNRKIKHQVLSTSRNFQRCLTNVSLALPASRRSFTKIQNDCVRRFHRVSGSHPQPSPTAKSRTAALAAAQVRTRRRWIIDCLRNSLNSWKHGLHEPRWSSQGSASVRETFPCAMPLSRELPGQPILSGLGNSVAKPCRSQLANSSI